MEYSRGVFDTNNNNIFIQTVSVNDKRILLLEEQMSGNSFGTLTYKLIFFLMILMQNR